MSSMLFKRSFLCFPYLLKFRVFVKPVSQNVRFKNSCDHINQIKCISKTSNCNKLNYIKMLSFSIFTWLGLEKDANEDSELIMTIKRSVLLIRRREYTKAEQMLHVALRLAQQLQDQLAITYIYDLLANVALENNQLEKANKLFVGVMQRLLANNVSENDLRIIHMNLKLARINHLKTDYALAQTGYEWSLSKLENYNKFESNSDSVKLYALAKNWYGHLLLDGGKSNEGLRYLLDSHLIYMDCDDKEEELIITQLSDIATAFEKNNDLDNCEKYCLEAIEKGKKVDYEHLGTLYINLGRLYIKKKLYDIARKRCGYGWRLGHDVGNKEIEDEAMKCVKEIQSITGEL